MKLVSSHSQFEIKATLQHTIPRNVNTVHYSIPTFLKLILTSMLRVLRVLLYISIHLFLFLCTVVNHFSAIMNMIKRKVIDFGPKNFFFQKTIYLHVLEVQEHEFSDFRGVNVKPSYPVPCTLHCGVFRIENRPKYEGLLESVWNLHPGTFRGRWIQIWYQI